MTSSLHEPTILHLYTFTQEAKLYPQYILYTYTSSRQIPLPLRPYTQYIELKSPHKLIRLLRKTKRENRMRQYARQMREETLIHRQRALGLDGPVQTIKRPTIQIAGLVVHPTHDGVGRVHDYAYHEAGGGGGEEVEGGSF